MKVLIIKPSSLGDIIHALRVVQLLVRSCGGMEIHWVVKKGLEGILEASGIVDQIFLFERGGGFFKYYRLGQALRAKKYDYVLDLQGLLRSAVLAKWANGKQTLGRADGREGATLFYQSVGEPDRKRELHAIERMIPFVEGTSFVSSKQDLFLLPEKNVEKMSRNHNVTVVNIDRQHLFGNFIENVVENLTEKGNSNE